MHMTRSISPNFCRSYFKGDKKLDEVDGFKLLGVTLSKDLSFDSQVGLVSDRISKLSGFINIIILIGWRGFRGKLLGFHFIGNVTVILKVDPTILKDLLIAI